MAVCRSIGPFYEVASTMPQLTPDILNDVVARCNSGLVNLSQAFSQALDATCEVTVNEYGLVEQADLAELLEASGLAMWIRVADEALLALMSESGGLLPKADADADLPENLAILAQKIGPDVLPEGYQPTDSITQRSEKFADVFAPTGIGDGAGRVVLAVKRDAGTEAPLVRVWPATQRDAAFPSDSSTPIAITPPNHRPVVAKSRSGPASPLSPCACLVGSVFV